MRRALASRLAKLEPKLTLAPVPNVLEVRSGETVLEAFGRFRRRWPHVRRDHRFMVVPATDTPAEFRHRSEARRAERQQPFTASIIKKDASL